MTERILKTSQNTKPSQNHYNHIEYLALVAEVGKLYQQADQLIQASDIDWLRDVYLGPLAIVMYDEVQGYLSILDDMAIYAQPEINEA